MVERVDLYRDTSTNDAEEPVLVGRAFFSGIGRHLSTTFTYDPEYVTKPTAFALQPNLPLSSTSYHVDGLPGFMLDATPNRWGRHLVIKRERELASQENRAPYGLDDVDFLLEAEDITRQGAVRYKLPHDGGYLGTSANVPKLIQLPQLLGASRAVASNQEGRAQVEMLLDAGSSSLGGARPKASVMDDGQLYLAKFPHPNDTWNVMAWEETALRLAAASGISTPRSRTAWFGADTVLLTRRFDRMSDGARIPYPSGMSVLDARDGTDADYADLADAISTFCKEPKAQLAELYRRVALSIALHNTDDHLRNHGFLRVGGAWTLSPLFDVNPNPAANEQRATAILGIADANECQALKESAPYFYLTDQQARHEVARVLSGVRTWKATAKRCGCPDAELRLFEPVITNRMSALRDAFAL